MTQNGIGFSEDPRNGNSIIHARTTGQLRSWEMPRSQRSLEGFNSEIGKSDFPGVYILLVKGKAYVGETESLYTRVKTHMATPDDKIKDWDRVVLINDGRLAAQSDFNDSVVRQALEYYLAKLLKANKYAVVSQAAEQTLNSQQKQKVESLKMELNVLLTKKNIITKVLEERGQEEIFGDDLKKLLEKSGLKITNWGADEIEIDGEKAFVRPGSKKPNGWQITFRGRKPGSSIDALSKGKGFLLVSRDGVPLIPLSKVQKVIKDKGAYERDTIDIFIAFQEGRVLLRYKEETLDVTEFKLFDKA
jgi:predicted GIY-YIG superfamily endonuclease